VGDLAPRYRATDASPPPHVAWQTMALIEPKTVELRSGAATIRAATPEDAEQLEVLNQAIDRETEFLMRSPGELTLTLEEHRQFIAKTRDSKRNLRFRVDRLRRRVAAWGYDAV
jgi:hypothetical protein